MVARVAERAAVTNPTEGTAGFYTSAGTFPGNVEMSWIAALWCKRLQSTLPTEQMVNFQSGAGGMRLQWNAGVNRLQAIYIAAAGAQTFDILGFDVPRAMVDSMLLVGVTLTGSDTMRGYINGALSNGPVTQADTYLDNTSALTLLNTGSGVRPQPSWPLFAYAHVDEFRDDAAMIAAMDGMRDDLEQGRGLGSPFGATGFLFDARDVVIGGGSTRTTWADQEQGLVLTKSGRVEGRSYPARFV